MERFEDTEEYRHGEEAQQAVLEYLRSRGHSVLPVYGMTAVDPSTKAPVLLCPTGTVVVPDLLAFCPNDNTVWVEVKGKQRPGFYRIYKCHTHAIDYSLLEEYERVEEATGLNVWLVIRERKSPEQHDEPGQETGEPALLAISVRDARRLGERSMTLFSGRGGRGAWWWKRDDMKVLD